MKWTTTIAILLGVLAVGLLVMYLFRDTAETVIIPPDAEEITSKRETIGLSVEGRKIEAYTYGVGETHLLFVGGIHGGYEWNSVALAYEAIDHFKTNPENIPEDITITIIPSANPDGVYKVIGKEGKITAQDVPASVATEPGRFNANDVDLNRNFACKWQPESTWRGTPVSAGTAAFSEPEAVAIRNFVDANNITAAIFWHSQANTVYASECEDGVLPETIDIMNAYADAAGYNKVATFDAYTVTGDAEGWLASIGIPAITVELKTHETVEWEQNRKGIEALFEYYTNQTQ
jgi:predicted deacylase